MGGAVDRSGFLRKRCPSTRRELHQEALVLEDTQSRAKFRGIETASTSCLCNKSRCWIEHAQYLERVLVQHQDQEWLGLALCTSNG